MSALLGGLLSALWPYLAAAGAALVAVLTAYGKGRSDQKSKTETKDLRDANDIRKQGADARAGAAIAPEQLRDDDGWRRD
ncbi:MAG: hypothetical protein J0I54_22655 [Bosea sp.]|uniref:hypothetical protein n=1 Tax=unclassified Bosea (in: a-proteobacteria) TaxID=2653178 RepID=UPI00096978C0|nr:MULTISPECIES: hypothetical protein [unclassified Bosea (in: a-proteobacteria)]MBN9459438.1 hypothetical protein [Bosea sp. (in: a-proteobacteria)]OJV06376.1 MAG: hypothetical protein BGO20_12055 [Bosea sp. 67-29]